MGTIQKRGDKYQAQVCIKGKRKSKSFSQKGDAARWILRLESDAEAIANGRATGHYVRDALRKYSEEVSIHKRGWKKEQIRLKAFERMPFSSLPLAQISSADFAQWRDSRLREVSAASVIRDLTLLRSVFQTAVEEWRWISTNPVHGVKRPPAPKARDRLISPPEQAKMLALLDQPAETLRQTGIAFRLSLESAMRAGEILGLTWDRVFADYCRLGITKNGYARDVPLSKTARAIIDEMCGADPVKVFTISSAVLDSTFRKTRKRTGLEGFTFHDARATAITRLSKKVDILTLARISGHRDLKMLQVYYRESASDIASRL
jgi:integrase